MQGKIEIPKTTNRTFGVEIEVKYPTKYNGRDIFVNKVSELFGETILCDGYTHSVKKCWKAVPDGSFGSYGVEFVSPVLEYNDENLEQVKRLINAIKQAGGTVNTKCGLHVHVNASDLTKEQCLNVAYFYTFFQPEYNTIFHKNRLTNRYCNPCNYENYNSTSRYQVVNIVRLTSPSKPYDTIEFRQHHGSLVDYQVANWIALCVELTERAKDVPKSDHYCDDEDRYFVAACACYSRNEYFQRLFLRRKGV